MFKEKFGNLKNSLIKSEKKGGKKSVENLILLAILLIIVIVAINYIWKDNEKAKKDNANSTKVLADTNIIEENTSQNNDLEQKLKKIL